MRNSQQEEEDEPAAQLDENMKGQAAKEEIIDVSTKTVQEEIQQDKTSKK